MNTFLNRLNIVGMYSVVALIILTIATNIPAWIRSEPQPYFDIYNISVIYQGIPRENPELANPYSHILMHTYPNTPSTILRFDLDMDLRPIYTWGTKQVMAWLVVNYKTTTPTRSHRSFVGQENRVVVWDTIVQFHELQEMDLLIEQLEAKYPISALGGDIDHESMTITLEWETTPLLGFFHVQKGSLTRPVPATWLTSSKNKVIT